MQNQLIFFKKSFSEMRGETIEHYAMEQRVECVKELLFMMS